MKLAVAGMRAMRNEALVALNDATTCCSCGLLLRAFPAHAQGPAFRVDPYWPKPLPQQLDPRAGRRHLGRRAGQYLGVSAAALADRRRERRRARSAALEMLRAGAVGAGVQSVGRRREIVGRSGRQSWLRLAAAGARHPGRQQGLRLAQRQRQGRQHGVEVHHRRQVRQTDRQERAADQQHRSEPVRPGRRARDRHAAQTKSMPPTATAIIASRCSMPTPARSSASGAPTANRRPTRICRPTIPTRRNSPTRCIASRSARTAWSMSATAPTTACRCSARTARFVRQFVFEPDTRGPGSAWGLAFSPLDKKQKYFVLIDGTNKVMETVRRNDGTVVRSYRPRRGATPANFTGSTSPSSIPAAISTPAKSTPENACRNGCRAE